MKPNDKVVCVRDDVEPWDHEFDFPNGMPVKGEIYCVEQFFPPGSWCEGYVIGERFGGGVRLIGKPVIHRETGTLWIHQACNFRLVSEVGHPPVAIEQPVTA